MTTINAAGLDFTALCEKLRAVHGECEIENCLGQRFLANGRSDLTLSIRGIPGNALASCLDGGSVTVYGNAQDAVGDTMNAGRIVIHGSIGDAAGYAMRGGEIYVRGDAGYRAGIHMKAYKEKLPVLLIGGKAGSFLGEYQAGGIIAVLNLKNERAVGNFPCTGMHGGKLFLRGDISGLAFPSQVTVKEADEEALAPLLPHLEEFCRLFGFSLCAIMEETFWVAVPNTGNPYKQMYVQN